MDEPFDSPRFMIYKYHCKSVLHLSNDNLGLLFRTICEYQIDKDSLDKIDPRIAQVFPFFKNQFDLDDKKYQKLCGRCGRWRVFRYGLTRNGH